MKAKVRRKIPKEWIEYAAMLRSSTTYGEFERLEKIMGKKMGVEEYVEFTLWYLSQWYLSQKKEE